MNGDGWLDIIWRNQNQAVTQNNTAVWYLDRQQKLISGELLADFDVNSQLVGVVHKDELETVTLATASDSGVSNSDGITNVRTVTLNGRSSVGNKVSLFANNQLVGETTAGTAGTWSVVTTALEDGEYNLSARMTNKAGTVTRTIAGQKITVDGTTPDIQITGLKDGIGWDKQFNLAGLLRDMDPRAKVEYAVTQNGTLQVSAVMGATLENPTATGSTIRQQALAATQVTLGDATTAEVFKPYEVTLKATDRAGNVSTQVFKGMRLNLPELTEESFLLPGSGTWSYRSDERTVTTTNTLNNPTDGGGYLFIGTSGGWGYSSGSSGGSASWIPVNNTVTVPGNPTDLDSKVSYLAGLRLALTTAQKALSNHPTIATKKQSLTDHLEMVMAVGEVVEQNNLFQAMNPICKEYLGN